MYGLPRQSTCKIVSGGKARLWALDHDSFDELIQPCIDADPQLTRLLHHMDPRCPGGVGDQFLPETVAAGASDEDGDGEFSTTALERQRKDFKENVLRKCWVFGELAQDKYNAVVEKFERVELGDGRGRRLESWGMVGAQAVELDDGRAGHRRAVVATVGTIVEGGCCGTV